MSDFLERFGDLQVQCPVGMSDEVMKLSDFAETEQGRRYLGAIATTYDALSGSGMQDEQALTLAGSGAFVRDEQGQLAGLHHETPEPAEADAKKKLN